MKGKFPFRKLIILLLMIFTVIKLNLTAERINFKEEKRGNLRIFSLSNDFIKFSIIFDKEKIKSEVIKAKNIWLKKFGSISTDIQMDGDFMIEIVWGGWRAPGRVNNADNLIQFTKKNFYFKDYFIKEFEDGTNLLELRLKGEKNPFEIKLVYKLAPGKFYFRRKLGIRDFNKSFHFLHWFWPRLGYIFGEISIIKSGGFGQPVAMKIGDLGVFFGLEYPTSENTLTFINSEKTELKCGQEIGKKIGKSWIESEWVICGISPNAQIKNWFLEYVKNIRIAPLRPYLLYNSWYDLRAPEMVKDPSRAMTEENVLRTIASFNKKLYRKRGLALDAFVLDDGWDVYQSDWLLNREQFPNDFMPIIKALQIMNTKLGIWISPIGGYSHRDWRVGWMKKHGYETVGDQMCVGGKNYKELLKRRLRDFIHSYDISYFKIDGIQFICNEGGHGHLPSIYSRRAVMEAVIDLCKSLRSKKTDIFLNVTSGTWLSPWWLKYANTIWMQGYDYGYANVPSISNRDRAMTYRDSVLFDNFKKEDFWFPMANLMTHGIIKGHLLSFDGKEEPLEKFTDNAVLYFARGISMWELYISPDLLTDVQWDILAKAIHWAKDRFPILINTEMIGGDPEKRFAYGYIHYSNDRAIIAVRNPFIEPQILRVKLSGYFNLKADKLVLEKIYPVHWVSPELYSSTSVLNVYLQGYETAIYEIYPLKKAEYPLLTGCIYDFRKKNKKELILTCYRGEKKAYLLNPEKVKTIKYKDKKLSPKKLIIPAKAPSISVKNISLKSLIKKEKANISFILENPAKEAILAILIESIGKSVGEKDPRVNIFLREKEIETNVERQKGRWTWYTVKIKPGEYAFKINIISAQGIKKWEGLFSAWLICKEKLKKINFQVILKKELKDLRPFPPKPWSKGEIRKNVKLGNIKLVFQK
jgi:hypothetical protein